MEKELFEFQKNALLGNVSGKPLCGDYMSAWRACGNDKEKLLRLSLHQQSIPYVAHACHIGLGMTKKYVLENFSEYINGNKVFDDVEGVSGYTYELYAGHDGNVFVRSDVTSLMWCDANIVIPPTKCPRIYISNGSRVKIYLEGFNQPSLYVFDNSVVTIEDSDENSGATVFVYSDDAVVEEGKYCLSNKINIYRKEIRL